LGRHVQQYAVEPVVGTPVVVPSVQCALRGNRRSLGHAAALSPPLAHRHGPMAGATLTVSRWARRRAMRRIYRRGIALGLAAAAGLAVPAAAGAKPLEHDHFHDEEHETVVECGLTLQHDRVVDGHFLVNPHGPDGLAYAGEQLRGTDTFTNLANGHTSVTTFTFASRDLRVTDNGDGTLTILGQGAGNFVTSGSHSSVVLRNTGIQRVEVLIDHAGTPTDPFDDEFLEILGVVKEQTGRNDFGDFCDDLLLIAG
jgi:hypothetical protein